MKTNLVSDCVYQDFGRNFRIADHTSSMRDSRRMARTDPHGPVGPYADRGRGGLREPRHEGAERAFAGEQKRINPS